MWFVNVFVEDRDMKPSMYPIYTIVGKEQETKRVNIDQFVAYESKGKENAQRNGSKQIEIAVCIEIVVHF